MKKIFNTLITVVSAVLLISITYGCKKDTSGNQGEIDRGLIEAYVLEHQLTGEFTASGLYYQINDPGFSVHPTLNSTITVTYKAYTISGTLKDKGEFTSFKLKNLILGWQEGLQLIGDGGKIKLIVPSALAYGDEVMLFDITLHYFSK